MKCPYCKEGYMYYDKEWDNYKCEECGNRTG